MEKPRERTTYAIIHSTRIIVTILWPILGSFWFCIIPFLRKSISIRSLVCMCLFIVHLRVVFKSAVFTHGPLPRYCCHIRFMETQAAVAAQLFHLFYVHFLSFFSREFATKLFTLIPKSLRSSHRSHSSRINLFIIPLKSLKGVFIINVVTLRPHRRSLFNIFLSS